MSEITYNDIAKVNKEIKTVEIKGNQYAEVSERLKAFRKLHPNGTIRRKELTWLNEEKTQVMMTYTILDENGKWLADGTAFEDKNAGYINKTSFIENCETSAIGRALGICGFGDTSIASYEETAAANYQQEQIKTKEKKVTKVVATSLHDRCQGDENLEKYMLHGLGVESWSSLTNEIYERLNREWDKLVEKYKKGGSE